MKKYEYMTSEQLTIELIKGQKKQTAVRIVGVVLNVLILVVLVIGMNKLLPPAVDILDKSAAILDDVGGLSEQARLSMENANSLMNDADKMLSDNSEVIADIMNKLNGIDFVRLNEAIQRLADVVQPLARLFGGGS